MKFKKLITGMVLAMTLTVGVGVGVASLANKKVAAEPAAAATPSSYAKIYRFTAPAEYWGGTVYAYPWGSSTASNNPSWPGYDISSEYSYNESDRKVYTFCTNVSDYQYLIFHNNSGWQTDNITIGDNTAWYLDGGNTPGTWTPTNQTYNVYDYSGVFGGNAKCYAWQSGGSLTNGTTAGVAMTKISYGSGNLYTISLDCAFDEFRIVNGSTTTTDEFINHHRGQTFCYWKAGDITWDTNFNYVAAHDWVLNTMHIRDISTSITTDTGACKGASGYYQKAKSAYNSLSSDIKNEFQYITEYSDAQTRFSAWARANGETATFNGTILTVSKGSMPMTIINDESKDIALIVVIVSVASLTAVTGYLFLRKRREN